MISKRLERLTPYVPGEQPRDRSYIKLNTNENPYPPSPKISELLTTYDVEGLRRYPDPLFTGLRKVAAATNGLTPDYVFAGNGSDEILAFAFYAFFDSSVAYAAPSYSFYPVYSNYNGIQGVEVPLDDDLGIEIEKIAGLRDVDGMVIANPNSPTGAYIEFDRLEAVIAKYSKDRVIVIDEAYIRFGGDSIVPLVDRYENLLVVHTFSKWASLAGLRLGLAYGNPALIEALFKAKDAFNSYPVHDLAQQIGVVALEETDYYDDLCNRIIATRDRTAAGLTSLGWRVTPSRSNFLFVSHPDMPGDRAYTLLRERGILVRHFGSPELTNYLRITVGTDHDMDSLITELEQIHKAGIADV